MMEPVRAALAIAQGKLVNLCFELLPIGTRFIFADDPEWWETYVKTGEEECRVETRNTTYAGSALRKRPVALSIEKAEGGRKSSCPCLPNTP